MLLTEKFEVHDTLNPKLWNDKFKLHDEVKNKLQEIVKHFVASCDIPLNVADVHLVGSQASYNYTSKSDLDVHIVTNFELVDCPPDILQIAYNYIKAKFNSDYDITVKGIDVEMYIEDVNSNVTSNGIYSLLTDTWIKFPQKLDSVPQVDISNELDTWLKRVNTAIESKDPDTVLQLVNDIYLMRRNSLSIDGEYGVGNQIMKELRNLGILDKLRSSYKEFKSSELSLESLQRLHEDTRNALLSRSKSSNKGFERFKKRVKSRIANSVKQFNEIDMNKLFKDDILTVNISVQGETDSYKVRISFGGFTELLLDQINKQNGKLDYKAVTRALITGFNRDDVYINCSCADWQYRFNYYATKNQITSGDAENRPSNVTNPDDKLGPACKHVLLVLSNTSWLLKVASTIYNYINYMEKHYQKLYADIIYPAIYGKKYEEPVQLDMFDDDTLETDSDTLDKSNEQARTQNQFQKGNTQGVRFAPKENQQISIDDTTENESNSLTN